MVHYRIYYMAEEAARVKGFESIEADDDASAVARVEAKQRLVTMELWCANRMVRRWSLMPAADPVRQLSL